jgi:hypothetical protein
MWPQSCLEKQSPRFFFFWQFTVFGLVLP